MALIDPKRREAISARPARSNLLLRSGPAHIDGYLLDFRPPSGIADLNAHDIGA
jgi:hypothetical protein